MRRLGKELFGIGCEVGIRIIFNRYFFGGMEWSVYKRICLQKIFFKIICVYGGK